MAGPASSLLPAQFLPIYPLTLPHPYPSQILTDPHRYSQIPTVPSLSHPTQSSRTPILSPLQILTNPHKSPTDLHRATSSLSHLTITSLALLTGPACHCGRSRLLPPSKSIYISLFSFTEPHKSSHILTFLFYLSGPACHCGRSRLPPSPSPLA